MIIVMKTLITKSMIMITKIMILISIKIIFIRVITMAIRITPIIMMMLIIIMIMLIIIRIMIIMIILTLGEDPQRADRLKASRPPSRRNKVNNNNRYIFTKENNVNIKIELQKSADEKG